MYFYIHQEILYEVELLWFKTYYKAMFGRKEEIEERMRPTLPKERKGEKKRNLFPSCLA